MVRRRGFLLSPPRKVTLLIAIALWLFGMAHFIPIASPIVLEIEAAIPGLTALPGNPGVWALAAAGLIMFAGVIFEGI